MTFDVDWVTEIRFSGKTAVIVWEIVPMMGVICLSCTYFLVSTHRLVLFVDFH